MATYFISHSTPDRPFVEKELTDLLKALNINYWYCKEDIITGEQWERSIKHALEECDGLILVMSPASERSEWVKDEVNWAMNQKPGRVIPVLYRQCNLENFHIRLPRIQFSDFTTDENTARNKLIRFLMSQEHEAKSRVGTMNGVWKGTIHQSYYFDEGPISYPVELNLKVSAEGVFGGSVLIQLPHGESYFRLTGGFLFEKFIQFSYRSTDPGTIQFGSAVLELDSLGKTLKGKFIGYGARTQSIVDGTVEAYKSLLISENNA
jgi:hypothetical protein